MPAYKVDSISDQQLTEIWEYLGEGERPRTGKGLYEAFCANCHGIDGRGGFTGKNVIKEIEEFSEYIRKGKNVSYPLNRKKYMPAYRTSDLSSTEIRLMTQHAVLLRKQAGYPDHHGDDDEEDDD
jgi:cytochrome c5